MCSVLDRAFNHSLIYQPALIRNMAMAGNFVAMAEHEGKVVGALVGHIGLDDGLYLYSGPMAVLEGHRRRGVAEAMKLHQRVWALERNIERIVWPFHPRNVSSAHVSLTLPGVQCDRFDSTYYGQAPAGSRLLATWHLHEENRFSPSVTEWVQIEGRSDDDLVSDLDSAVTRGFSIVRVVGGRYGLARSENR